jgi:hypothetical protein
VWRCRVAYPVGAAQARRVTHNMRLSSRCLNKGPGVNAISNTQDAGYYYPKKMGPVIQAWYLTCKRSRSSGLASSSRGRGASESSKAAYSQVPAMLCHVCTRALTLEHE